MTQVIPEQWDIASPLSFDDTTSQWEYREFLERNISVTNRTEYTFDINERDNWILPSKGYAQYQLSITKASGGTDFTAASPTALVNNAAAGMFERTEYRINDKQVEHCYYQHERAHVQNLLEYSKDYSSQAQDELWYTDSNTGDSITPFTIIAANVVTEDTKATKYISVSAAAGGNKTITDLSITDSTTYNAGFHERQKITVASGATTVITVRIPLARLFNFCRDVKHAFIGSTHRIVFNRNIDNDLLHNAHHATVPGQITLSDMSIWLPVLKPSLSMKSQLTSFLARDQQLKIGYELGQIHRSIEQVSGSVKWNISTLTEKPKRVFIWFKDASQLNAPLVNNMVMKHKSLTSCFIRYGSKQYPMYRLEGDFRGF
eukprot:Lithocolla_globosa_v1_NODE_2125_length_2154_cov_87.383516.p1 type:complete len:375 gc:universal NODE_2125_length_2154_cov_87.383516:1704-580(-)